MAIIENRPTKDSLPCEHVFPKDLIDPVIAIIKSLSGTHPELLAAAGIDPDDWSPLLRAAIERMRGSSAADETEKRRFVHAILQFCQEQGTITRWEFIGGKGRQDYKVELPDGTLVAIESKGCPDGNNTTIWDRPTWANEFIVWSQCPESLTNPPGTGAWSGVANRLLPDIVAKQKAVDAFITWDGRCGTPRRPCPKEYGIAGTLRSGATDLRGQFGQEDWLPAPCIYLLPRSAPTVPNNTQPSVHTTTTCRFASALMKAFGIPATDMEKYAHSAHASVRGTSRGTEILIKTISRGWPDGNERSRSSDWKDVKREA
ncbi:hypothetical protein Aple_067780 [Acrocarpospora pleiomorpha]|uniref:Uncharacterized protein n=1 Tax=Acrocarpospora pleiomorpha TaxID=90975 RepID=A0A5M3XV22_9ACTN|nr:hypothetical protein [Acrocarpospora pleiomorpha]GES23879.1 hypothetical protein Aple_067780 [Acrocarpospora pleiomorpha]